jgi:putative transposase
MKNKSSLLNSQKIRVYSSAMPRQPRHFQAGGFYHIVNRGNNKQTTFYDDGDYQQFLRLLSKGCDKYSVDIISMCLMPNHFHILTTPSEISSIESCIGYSTGIYAKYLNQKYDRVGHLWQRRYWSGHVEKGRGTGNVWRYIEQNPVRANMVSSPEKWKWSSATFRSTGFKPHYLIEPNWWGSAVMQEWWSNDKLTQDQLVEIRNSYLVPGT